MATKTHAQVRENPALQKMPTSQIEWVHFMNELSKWVSDVDVNGMFTDERIMPQVLLSNAGSVQTTVPITAEDAGASVTVTVASHILQRKSGAVSYNSGTITGLSYSSTYYIYTDDPTFAGGSVTYLSTTDKADIVGAIGRYFVGEVLTPAAAEPSRSGGPGGGAMQLQLDQFEYGVPASSSSRGIVRTAVVADVDTGTDDEKAVTAAAIAGSTLATKINAIATSSPAYTPTNVSTDRSFDADTVAVDELADVVGTLIADLQTKNVLG